MALRRLGLLVAALALVTTAAPVDGEAFQGATGTLGKPVLDAAVATTDDGEVVLLGGRDGSGPLETVQVLDPATGSSRVLDAELPNATQSASAAWTGDEVALFGGAHFTLVYDSQLGASRVEVVPHDSILRYDPNTEAVLQDDARLPDAVFATAAAPVDDDVYVFGGLNRTRNATGTYTSYAKDWVLRYDADAAGDARLQQVATLPAPMRDAMAVAHDGHVYLMGGIVEVETEEGGRVYRTTDAIQRFDPTTGNVTVLDARLPYAMRWAGVARADDMAYLFGGCRASCDDPARDQLETVVRVDLTTHEVRTLAPTLPSPQVAPMAATVDGSVLVAGGGRGPQNYDVVYDDVRRFTPGPTPPSAPRDVTANGTEAGVELAWTPPLDDGGYGVDAYTVERKLPGGAFEPLLELGPNATAAVDAAAPPETPLVYRVRAAAEAGPGPASEPANATAPPRPPTAPQHVEALGLAASVLVRWDAPADPGGREVTSYVVLRDGDVVARTSDRSLSDGNVTRGSTYAYEVVAENAVGQGPAGGPADATPVARLPPAGNLTATVEEGEVRLAWDPPAGAVDTYRVLRGPHRGNLTQLAETPDPAYADGTVDPGTAYLYQVVAVNASGPGAPSRTLRAALLEAPSAPRSVDAEVSGGTVAVTWRAPGDLGGAEAVTYRVERQAADDAAFETVRPAGWTGTSWEDPDPPAGVRVRYRVVAANDAGEGPASPQAHADVPRENEAPTAALTTTQLRAEVGEILRFDASASSDPDGEVDRTRFRFGDGADTGWVQRTSAQHAYQEAGTYTVQVQVRDDAGAVSAPANATVVVAEERDDPDPPDGNTSPDDDPPPEGPDDGDGGSLVPGPGVGAAVAAVALAGVVRARRRRGG